jgi:hypothetical protein
MNSHDANEAAFIQPKLLVALARHVALDLNAQVSGLERGKSWAPNLANSRGYSVKEVITVAEKVCGRSYHRKQQVDASAILPILIGGTRVRRAGSLAGTYAFGLGDTEEP